MVGQGWHVYEDELHAEARALEHAGAAAAGATVYVTLEPCAHTGRTPPCSDALVRAGVARVVYGASDPSDHAEGAGPALLRRRGIEVEGGVLREACEDLCRAFLHFRRTQRALLTAKAACGPDGRLAVSTGESRWISGEASRRFYRRLRADYDAVVVGAGTLERDDPDLRARCGADRDRSRRPAAVVLATGLETLRRGQRLWQRAEAGEEVLVATRRPADPDEKSKLEGAGFQVIELSGGPRGEGVDLEELAGVLGRRGLLSVLVEGGGRVLASIFDARLADRILLFQAPLLLGGESAPQLWGGQGVASLDQAPRLEGIVRIALGADEVLDASLHWPGAVRV